MSNKRSCERSGRRHCNSWGGSARPDAAGGRGRGRGNWTSMQHPKGTACESIVQRTVSLVPLVQYILRTVPCHNGPNQRKCFLSSQKFNLSFFSTRFANRIRWHQCVLTFTHLLPNSTSRAHSNYNCRLVAPIARPSIQREHPPPPTAIRNTHFPLKTSKDVLHAPARRSAKSQPKLQPRRFNIHVSPPFLFLPAISDPLSPQTPDPANSYPSPTLPVES